MDDSTIILLIISMKFATCSSLFAGSYIGFLACEVLDFKPVNIKSFWTVESLGIQTLLEIGDSEILKPVIICTPVLILTASNVLLLASHCFKNSSICASVSFFFLPVCFLFLKSPFRNSFAVELETCSFFE